MDDGKSFIHVNIPRAEEVRVRCGLCPDCEREKSVFVELHYLWYGWSSTCLRCGRSFEDGEWIPLPSERYARRDSIAAARRRYRRVRTRLASEEKSLDKPAHNLAC